MAGESRLYLGRLPQSISESDIYKYLSIYGTITEVIVRTGYGIVRFASARDAMDVLAMFSKRRFLGYDVIFKQYEPRNQSNNSYGGSRSLANPHSKPISEAARNWHPVVLTNLNPRICWQELKDFGRSSGGNVAFCAKHKNDRTIGFINYTRKEDADRALRNLHRKELLGRTIYVLPYDAYKCGQRQHMGTGDQRGRSRSPPPRHLAEKLKFEQNQRPYNRPLSLDRGNQQDRHRTRSYERRMYTPLPRPSIFSDSCKDIANWDTRQSQPQPDSGDAQSRRRNTNSDCGRVSQDSSASRKATLYQTVTQSKACSRSDGGNEWDNVSRGSVDLHRRQVEHGLYSDMSASPPLRGPQEDSASLASISISSSSDSIPGLYFKEKIPLNGPPHASNACPSGGIPLKHDIYSGPKHNTRPRSKQEKGLYKPLKPLDS